MQAIITKIIPATNTRPTRIKAQCARGSIMIPTNDALSPGETMHGWAVNCLVARFLKEDLKQYGTPVDKNPWGRRYCSGSLPSGDFVHVYCGSKLRAK